MLLGFLMEKIKEIENNLFDTVNILTESVELLIDRGENIDKLDKKSNYLMKNSDKYIETIENNESSIIQRFKKHEISKKVYYWWCEFKVLIYNIYSKLNVIIKGVDINSRTKQNFI